MILNTYAANDLLNIMFLPSIQIIRTEKALCFSRRCGNKLSLTSFRYRKCLVFCPQFLCKDLNISHTADMAYLYHSTLVLIELDQEVAADGQNTSAKSYNSTGIWLFLATTVLDAMWYHLQKEGPVASGCLILCWERGTMLGGPRWMLEGTDTILNHIALTHLLSGFQTASFELAWEQEKAFQLAPSCLLKDCFPPHPC
jgi:hypothetical protein